MKYTMNQFDRAESRVMELKRDWQRHKVKLTKAEALEERVRAEMKLTLSESHVLSELWCAMYTHRENTAKKWERAKKRYLKIARSLDINVNGFSGLTLT